MFHRKLVERNSIFSETTGGLQQAGQNPAHKDVLDLNILKLNAKLMSKEAKGFDPEIYAMTKQIDRNTPALRAHAAGMIDPNGVVDLHCARFIHEAGFCLRHSRYLVQISESEALWPLK